MESKVNLKEKIENAFISKAAEGVAVAVGVLVIWVGKKLAPVLLPALEQKLQKDVLVSIMLASLALNLLILLLFWILTKSSKSEFELRYGIYWDKNKNPHCPNCKIPVGAYSHYQAGWGYYCKPCGKIFPLTDAVGNDVKPEKVLAEL